MIHIEEKAMSTPPGVLEAHAHRMRRMLRAYQADVQREIDVFAEQEIVIPTGPYAGYAFRIERQPYARLFFDEVKRGCWNEITATGPTQSGKTLICFVIPMMFHLFEKRESIIVMAPNDDICKEKWLRDILPVIQATRYRKFLPISGAGAKKGFGDFIQFANGASIKWMTAGGGDQSRSHYTARVIFMTEVDSMATRDTTSHEADKVSQAEGRTNSYGRNRLIYKECTVTVPEGHIWQCYTSGTKSRIMTPCPHCNSFVHLEREHLVGWQGCETDVAALRETYFGCPSCGEKWTEENRRDANVNAVLLHDGQTIDGGVVGGTPRETFTLGFRWTAANNMLVEAGFVGVQEWEAERSVNRDNAERKLKQQYWAEPYEDPNIQINAVDPRQVQRRQAEWPRGYVPRDAKWMVVGCDIGLRLLHWTAMAVCPTGRRHIVDYGRVEVASDDLGIERALPLALSELRDKCDSGWLREDGSTVPADEVWIDSGHWSTLVFAFIHSVDQGRYRPTLGRGFGQMRSQWYARPKSTGAVVRMIGDEYHISYVPDKQIFQVTFNTDYYKTKLHMGLQTKSDDAPHRVTLFKAIPIEHTSFAAHLSAEEQVDKFIPERGNVKVWKAKASNNHWLDATTLAMVNSTFCLEYRNESEVSESQQQHNPGDESNGENRPAINLRRAIA